jgi:two-component system, chemotaxis family, response regulator Rcp1
MILKESRSVEILLVEDNPADVRLTREALRQGKFKNNLHAVPDGQSAMEFLRRQGAFRESPTPDLIFLDLNLPGMDGREVLEQIKVDPELRRIPVVVLTTSDAEDDILHSYELHANCYITKPVGLDEFLAVIHQIDNFWLEVVKLPPLP